ncbi:MAG: glycosyltransferase [Bacteroidota bacterium]|nr:mannosyltransferase [Odoribacter sp.]MDP3644018.1 glycosyltransferase [Bacteroidota bacterium]
MVETALQLVAFNIPYPPDYGGVIDVFYKVKTLSECGISVYLHCFEYDRPQAEELEKYCAKVFYYKRKKGIRYQFSTKPYIVITRTNDQLINNLSSNKAPILFEGLHTCYFLDHPSLANHLRLVRTHNVEHEYYQNLVLSEPNLFKKIFFRIEACKLKRFEKIFIKASHLLCISPNDNFYFDHHYGHSHFIPAFHPFSDIKSRFGLGKYILFHGNLSVSENLQALEFLIKNVFSKIRLEVIIAGKNPADRLAQKIKQYPNILLISNPENEQMERLIQNAHICLIPTFQDTGLKLKLLASLFSGRFCITNTPMVHKTGLEHLCHIADAPDEMIGLIKQLFDQEFTSDEIVKRKLILEDAFSNRRNAMKIIQILNESTNKS